MKYMNDIYELSKIDISDNWRGIKFNHVKIYPNYDINCNSNCRFQCKDNPSAVYIKSGNKITFTIVIYELENTNSYPIYSDFVEQSVLVTSDRRQVPPIQEYLVNCLKTVETIFDITDCTMSIMPHSITNRIVIYPKLHSKVEIDRIAYRGKIFANTKIVIGGFYLTT